MCTHVLVFVKLVEHRIKDATNDGKHRRAVEKETQLAEALPLAAAQSFVLKARCQKIAHHAQNGREERKQEGEMADVARAEVFVDVGDFLQGGSIVVRWYCSSVVPCNMRDMARMVVCI